MTVVSSELREQCVNTIRFLAADAVQKANSGHPGAPMGTADIAFVLWTQFMRYNPEDPQWVNRDRFVLSIGHASTLLYSMLHLAGYKISLEDLKQFRQWESITPGHPEYRLTPGVECTTGPLGAGFSNGVGMALAAKMTGARFNTKDTTLIDSRVYVLCGDGDMQEGVVSEAAALAGLWGLGNLIAIYDSNNITIAGSTKLSMNEDTGKRFESLGWHVQHCDGHNQEQIADCIRNAQNEFLKPSLIIAKTTIAKGAPTKAGKSAAHGSPLGHPEIQAAKEQAGLPNEAFLVPDAVRKVFDQRKQENLEIYTQWNQTFKNWRNSSPDKAEQWDTQWNLKVPDDLLESLLKDIPEKVDATRNLSGKVMQKLSERLPWFVGGSADLEPSTKTLIDKEKSILPASVASASLPDPSFAGRNIHFGIREHAMGNICNGIYLFGGWQPYCSTFSVFSDYMRGSIRLAAISRIPTVFILSHDSFWVGEDGPTHQPTEHTWVLRLIPHLKVWRPADTVETIVAWTQCLGASNSSAYAMLLSRQNTETIEQSETFDPAMIAKGGYIVSEPATSLQAVLVSTGAESGPAQQACKIINQNGTGIRHVSMPCLEQFLEQPEEYRKTVLPASAKIIVVEAGSTTPWYRYADHVIGRDDFGDSAPGELLAEKYGFTAETIAQNILSFLKAC
ncbi:MAG: transketolase [SAR324 cluster bacterium]|nr:transketolase [SAR324 cluster bacterium]